MRYYANNLWTRLRIARAQGSIWDRVLKSLLNLPFQITTLFFFPHFVHLLRYACFVFSCTLTPVISHSPPPPLSLFPLSLHYKPLIYLALLTSALCPLLSEEEGGERWQERNGLDCRLLKYDSNLFLSVSALHSHNKIHIGNLCQEMHQEQPQRLMWAVSIALVFGLSNWERGSATDERGNPGLPSPQVHLAGLGTTTLEIWLGLRSRHLIAIP